MKAFHQFTAGFSSGDAITNEALTIQAIIRSWGYDSEIFTDALRNRSEMRNLAHDAADYAKNCSPDDIVLLHLSIGSIVNDIFADLPCRKAILYHNITPPHYFDLINPEIAHNLEHGRRQMKALAGKADINMADSNYNAMELQEQKYNDVKVLPLIMDFSKLESKPDSAILKQFNDDTVNILFVGRCVPNKCLEDLLDAFAVFNQTVQPQSRLIHVGSSTGAERYRDILSTQANELDIRDHVHFIGSVSQSSLNAFYKCADLFLCMSEHEGFCIPIIESFVNQVPVLAFDVAAVPDTMGGAGVLFKEKKYEAIAEMMGKLTKSNALRQAVLDGQKARLNKFRQRDLAAELKTHLGPLLLPS